jgi:LemA protein
VDPSIPVVLAIAVPVVGLLWLLGAYNGMVKLRAQCRESWSNVDTELKRRYDLIPNLVETVKAYAVHEREVLERVAQLRSAAVASTGSPSAQASDENRLVAGLRGLLAIAEGYPTLRADAQFLALQKELSLTEDRIQAARRFFNANVRDLNTRVEQFPTNVLARTFGIGKEEYFEIDPVQAAPPPVRV